MIKLQRMSEGLQYRCAYEREVEVKHVERNLTVRLKEKINDNSVTISNFSREINKGLV